MASQKILIVDDSKVIRMQVRDMLPKGNFEVLEAQDGIEGLQMISQEFPNLVLLDFFMPRLNGWEVLQKIQAHPKLQTIPVVMMSGRREDVEQSAPELFDYFEFLNKPFGQDLLLRAIKSAMAKAKQRRPTPAAPAVPPAQSTQASSTQAAIAPTPAASGTDDLTTLKAEVQRLHQQNAMLHAEVDGLKKQVAQIMAFIRQKAKTM